MTEVAGAQELGKEQLLHAYRVMRMIRVRGKIAYGVRDGRGLPDGAF